MAALMDDAFVTVGSFHRLDDANFAKSLLDGAGIPAVLVGDATVGMAWHLAPALGGVLLKVRKQDEEAARALLQPPADAAAEAEALADDAAMHGPDPEQLAAEAEEESSDWTPREQLAQRAFRAAIVGLVLLPVEPYATWLLLRWLFTRGRMRPRFWLRIGVAWVVNALAWAVLVSAVSRAG